jgi:hypothetical protein
MQTRLTLTCRPAGLPAQGVEPHTQGAPDAGGGAAGAGRRRGLLVTGVSYRAANPGEGRRDTYVRGTRNCMPVCKSVCPFSCVCARAPVRPFARSSFESMLGKTSWGFQPPAPPARRYSFLRFHSTPTSINQKAKMGQSALAAHLGGLSLHTRLHEHSLAVVLGVESTARVPRVSNSANAFKQRRKQRGIRAYEMSASSRT